MTQPANIRPERSFEQFSRGPDLVRAIRKVWDTNVRLPRSLPDLNDQINANCEEVTEEFDLNYPEWHYWCHIARQEG